MEAMKTEGNRAEREVEEKGQAKKGASYRGSGSGMVLNRRIETKVKMSRISLYLQGSYVTGEAGMSG